MLIDLKEICELVSVQDGKIVEFEIVLKNCSIEEFDTQDDLSDGSQHCDSLLSSCEAIY